MKPPTLADVARDAVLCCLRDTHHEGTVTLAGYYIDVRIAFCGVGKRRKGVTAVVYQKATGKSLGTFRVTLTQI